VENDGDPYGYTGEWWEAAVTFAGYLVLPFGKLGEVTNLGGIID